MVSVQKSENLLNVKGKSKKHLYAWISRLEGLSHYDEAVLMALASRSDTEGASTPRQDHLAKALKVSVRTVKSAIARLIKLGAIERRFRYSKRGKRTASRYLILWEQNAPIAQKKNPANPTPAVVCGGDVTKGTWCPITYNNPLPLRRSALSHRMRPMIGLGWVQIATSKDRGSLQ